MTKSLNPLEALISTQALVFRELTALAEIHFGMGPESGAKRSILMLIASRPALPLSDLMEHFGQHASNSREETYLIELSAQGYITIDRDRRLLMITPTGQAKLKSIQMVEAQLAGYLQTHGFQPADLKLLAQNMEMLRSRLEEMRLQSSPEKKDWGQAG